MSREESIPIHYPRLSNEEKEMKQPSAGRAICLYFTEDRLWILNEIDRRTDSRIVSRTDVLEQLLRGEAGQAREEDRYYAVSA